VNVLGGYEPVLKELAERIRSDFETVLPNLELRFTTYAAWIADDPAASALPTKDDIVCVTPRSSFPIQIAEGVESGCFRVAYELQDEVIDDLQRPWPAF
jgi:hypothetical protein